MRAILLVVTLSVLGAVGSDRGRSPALARHSRIERLHWLARCWERVSGERTIEEQWMRPRGRSMLGMGRTVRGDSTVEYELMRIVERESDLVFIAQPSGLAQAEFVASVLTDSAVTFANPAHDFPQRVLYRRGTADSLWARIEGVSGGKVRGLHFRYRRVACTS